MIVRFSYKNIKPFSQVPEQSFLYLMLLPVELRRDISGQMLLHVRDPVEFHPDMALVPTRIYLPANQHWKTS